MKPVDNNPTRAGYLRPETTKEDFPVNSTSVDPLESIGKDALLGTTVGNYLIVSVIASGGMGTVYRAEQLQPIRRDVALKMIKGGLADRKTIERFHVERQALALMDHPDIARVYEADSTPAGNPYFAMEFCSGQPIDQFCQEKQLDLRSRIELVVRIARAVSRAHSHGVVHRDLKPDNVLVSACEGRPNLKVIDFGIAKLNETCQSEQTNEVTRFGEIIGTPGYMSPEQAFGKAIDGRTDVFAIGAILFKLLTGTAPIQWLDGLPSIAEIIARVQAFEPETPSRRFASLDTNAKQNLAGQFGNSQTTFARSLQGDLDWIALRALEPNRMQRYATADDLADDLERHLRHETVTAVAPSLRYRAKKLYQRHRALVLSTAAMASTMLVAGSALGINWYDQLRQEQMELASTSSEIDRLLIEVDSARRVAASGGPLAESSFVAAQTALAQVESLLANERLANSPGGRLLLDRFQKTQSRIELDLGAQQLAKRLSNARDGAVDVEEALAGDAFGRTAIREQVSDAFAEFSIDFSKTEPAVAAEVLKQSPEALHESLIESLDFMLTETPVGAGLFLSQQGGRLTVADVVYGGGSANAGQIRVGDRLLGIGELDLTEKFNSSELAAQAYRLLGSQPGTRLTLRFAPSPTDVRECVVVCGGHEAKWAFDVLRFLDADPWRLKLRTAIIQSDVTSLKRLSQEDLTKQNDAGLLQLANALLLWDRSNESIRFMESTQKKFPSNFWLNQLLGKALLDSHTPPRPEASARYLTAAVALRPASVGARLELARTLVALGDRSQANEQKSIAKSLSQKSSPATPHFVSTNAGRGAVRSSKTAKLLENDDALVGSVHVNDEQNAIERNRAEPKVSEGNRHISTLELSELESQCTILARSGNRTSAMSLILDAGKNGVEPLSLRRAKAIVLLESKDYIAARIILAELVTLTPDDPVCRLYLAFALSELGATEPAIEQCQAVLQIHPEFDRARVLLNVLLNR
ncbi:MAG: protein kinase [Pirellulales bacterium]